MNILFTPLDWGLGHASRDIPLIKDALANNNKIFVAATPKIIHILKQEFPQITYIEIFGYNIKYSNILPASLKISLQIPKIFGKALKEHILLKQIIKKYQIDLIISDNRYGMCSKNVKSIIICHQISLKAPPILKFSEKFIYRIHKYFIMKFDKCLVPDFDTENMLAGDLAHKYKIPQNAIFIGPLSRFKYDNEKKKIQYNIVVILSGPEPQRTIFENKIIEQLRKSKLKTLIIQGLPQGIPKKSIQNINFINHLSSKKMQETILSSELVVSRAGYSTIMDLYALKKCALLVPTPGQTEQEYLAEYLSSKKIFLTQKQNKIDIELIYEKIFTQKKHCQAIENKYFNKLSFEKIIKF